MIWFDERRIARAYSDRFLDARSRRANEIVRDDFNPFSGRFGKRGHGFGVVFAKRVLDRDDWIAFNPTQQHF